jgi:nicotinamide mononucleotide transporter
MIQSFFDTNNIFFTVLNYPMSHLEFWGTILSVIAVSLAAKENIWSWGIGMASVFLYFFLFYQVQLYPDMFLQVFFFMTNAIGWWTWANPSYEFENQNKELKITRIENDKLLIIIALGLVGTLIMGYSAQNLSVWLPKLFSKPSAFPYLDSFTTVLSVMTTFLMIRKKVECWWLWLAIDIISTYIYWQKGVKFVSIIYFVYCFIALFGAINWTKEYRNSQNIN